MSKFDPPTTTPTAYGYGRVSHLNSLEKAESLPAQENRIQNYYETRLAAEGIQWGGCDTDGTSVSAFKVMFHCRPAGKRIMAKLQPGDHLILDKVDRIWRSLNDFIRLMEKLESKGVTVHIVSFLGSSIQNNTPMGQFMLKQFVLMAELESTIKAERIKEAINIARIKGRRTGSFVPYGCRIVKAPHPENPKRTISNLHWCEQQRTIMAEIVRLLDDERLQWDQAHDKIEAFIAKVERRAIRSLQRQASDRKQTWPNMYAYETAYRYLGVRDPSQIPKRDVIREAARQYKRERANRRYAEKGANRKSNVPEISPEQLLNLAAAM